MTRFIIALFVTIGFIFLLAHPWGNIPPLGSFLSPQEGFWQNAEPLKRHFPAQTQLPALRDSVEVWLDRRWVPHIFARNRHDLFFMQGYVTAMFRLWQMDIQTMAAGGQLASIMGPDLLPFDRLQRRKGMVYGAEQKLKAMEADSVTKEILDAYTAGVNAYIQTLTPRTLPLEYKLLHDYPRKWTNLRSALLIEYMADDLTGHSDDREYSNLRRVFTDEQLHRMFPDFPDSSAPIIPPGTAFAKPSRLNPAVPTDTARARALLADSALLAVIHPASDYVTGSNNWAVSGSKTASHVPILCNDPHLSLNLPSLWFEIQLHAPGINVYGVSLPGAPAVIIGFNDSIAWGVTNAARDVKDYYAVHFTGTDKKTYIWNGKKVPATLRIETIQVKGEAPFHDTVAYTIWGPVTFDPDFPDTITHIPYLATHWQALEPSNDLKTFYLLNCAHNYQDYVRALAYFNCPAQNFVYADKAGHIAIWQQGWFPLRWKDQGKYVMPGDDEHFQWQGYVPVAENPHVVDPPQGFVFSANQHPTDPSYPYYYTGDFFYYRAKRIHDYLSSKSYLTLQDMMRLQNDVYDTRAAEALPLLLAHLPVTAVRPSEREYDSLLRHWNMQVTAQSKAPILFYAWMDTLMHRLWDPVLSTAHRVVEAPSMQTTIEWLLRDTTMQFFHAYHNPPVHLTTLVTESFHAAMDAVRRQADNKGIMNWGQFRGTSILHLTRLDALSVSHLPTPGDGATVNAITSNHGPSWRMIVQLGNPTKAYGVYPGGQSGNPGSPHYDDMIHDWLLGRYEPLRLYTAQDRHHPDIEAIMHFTP
ncbi:penicillin acylase family protein [Thermoflavifilum thermophilum]|uniref:Penicillin amidase n=1 Tax=Thermoflavifilum thermophilum TaxID=1393122 RepID=A0A1I7NMK3_9BACT|nr:penicillin acylase family protein [Thermoflavifilum thermophilum]SFV35810.1 penicillin amidase [Thermoflavifilum thermophilum]